MEIWRQSKSLRASQPGLDVVVPNRWFSLLFKPFNLLFLLFLCFGAYCHCWLLLLLLFSLADFVIFGQHFTYLSSCSCALVLVVIVDCCCRCSHLLILSFFQPFNLTSFFVFWRFYHSFWPIMPCSCYLAIFSFFTHKI